MRTFVVNGSSQLVGHLDLKDSGERQFECAGAKLSFVLHFYRDEFQQPPLGLVRTFVKCLWHLAVSQAPQVAFGPIVSAKTGL
jgi:hypothetical protein